MLNLFLCVFVCNFISYISNIKLFPVICSAVGSEISSLGGVGIYSVLPILQPRSQGLSSSRPPGGTCRGEPRRTLKNDVPYFGMIWDNHLIGRNENAF